MFLPLLHFCFAVGRLSNQSQRWLQTQLVATASLQMRDACFDTGFLRKSRVLLKPYILESLENRLREIKNPVIENKFSQDQVQTKNMKKGEYDVFEVRLLDEIYGELPHVSSQKITWVLSGKTKKPQNPVYIAVENVINKIREREEKS